MAKDVKFEGTITRDIGGQLVLYLDCAESGEFIILHSQLFPEVKVGDSIGVNVAIESKS